MIFIPLWINPLDFNVTLSRPVYINIYIEWVSDCCLASTQQFFQLYHGENKLIFNEMMMRSALFQTNTLSCIFIVLAHWNNTPRIDMSPHLDTIAFEPTSRCSFFLMLRVYWRSNKYQFHSLLFYPIGARTHDPPNSKQAHYPLHYRCGWYLHR